MTLIILITLIILSIIGAIILLDFTLIGFIPEKLEIWGSLKKVAHQKLIEDTAKYSMNTDITGKYIDYMINNMIGYKALILTSEALIVKNTYLTYLLKIDNSTIESYEIKTGIAVKRFKLNLKIQKNTKVFEFSTNKYARWIQEFSALNIPETQKS
jgi:hypothetical protein